MLPSRPRLIGWNPDELAASAAAIVAAAQSTADSVRGLDDAIAHMPETRGWSGESHDAAADLFGRANRAASRFCDYGTALASALKSGSGSIGSARVALLTKADEIDQTELHVTDQWVVLIKPARMTAEKLAGLLEEAQAQQEIVNRMLLNVGDADEDTANAVLAVGNDFGFTQPPTGPGNWADLLLPKPQRPGDEVPDPGTVAGLYQQGVIRGEDMGVTVRETTESTDQWGNDLTTLTMQDGSKQVIVEHDPFDDASKMNFVSVFHYDKNGNQVSESSSWHDLSNDCDYTSVSWPDGSNFIVSVDRTGYRTAGFTTSDGRHQTVPVELIDNVSTGIDGALTGLEKHIGQGGKIPMLTAQSTESLGKATRVAGPALGIATTLFDMAMAESRHDACVAAISGVFSGAGGWGGAEGGAAFGALTGPAAPLAVPAFAVAGGVLGGVGLADVGKTVGDVICPY
jgi:uncharacterized protein YukE